MNHSGFPPFQMRRFALQSTDVNNVRTWPALPSSQEPDPIASPTVTVSVLAVSWHNGLSMDHDLIGRLTVPLGVKVPYYTTTFGLPPCVSVL